MQYSGYSLLLSGCVGLEIMFRKAYQSNIHMNVNDKMIKTFGFSVIVGDFSTLKLNKFHFFAATFN